MFQVDTYAVSFEFSIYLTHLKGLCQDNALNALIQTSPRNPGPFVNHSLGIQPLLVTELCVSLNDCRGMYFYVGVLEGGVWIGDFKGIGFMGFDTEIR